LLALLQRVTAGSFPRMNVIVSYAMFVSAVRTGLLYLAVVVAAVCAVDWAVRTRRIGPFNRVSRFFRSNIDPLMAPVERMIVRSGGLPANAPWWTLGAIVVGGILLISLLQFVGGILTQVVYASSTDDPFDIVKMVAGWGFGVLRLALLVRVLSSWLPISPYSKWIRWAYVLTEWMIAPLRRIIPRIGMIDITPIIAWFALNLIQRALEIP
jgi:YggT family protein